ncbi:diaminopropionate ammonia-lyase [Ancylobacter sp. 6x-1]|uniref:Diaminopropionate ammonia-lyase n=1 Tax=Ancylobacter crimeensis TaxID=2579147 RepID=A0ABT0D785_9HYPH|nr:diaminopropionate ammonia-lyase [Ancylobacter crimeensis]MCK0195798.1 diaminopropionate ammonia-lyase [Ancylobacter crimeensis]
MFLSNAHPDYRQPLDPADGDMLGEAGADAVDAYLAQRDNHAPTPLHALPGLAAELGVGALHVKDEGFRLGLGSFKALGGAYAVARLVLAEAGRALGRPVEMEEMQEPAVRAVAAGVTVACATDGNHGRSVAQGAGLMGAAAAIFVHSGVSDERVAAIARYGARMIRVEGTYDDSVAEATRVAQQEGWTIVSDTSWPGYEQIPALVMQGYTAMVREALRQLPELPTHVFVQAGVGGVAAAVAAHLQLVLGERRPRFIVVEPARAACVCESVRVGAPVRIAHGEPTVMAMLECYEPSRIAWRVLSRAADAFMTVDEEDAVAVMNRLARPVFGDPAIVAGESGGAGLAGLLRAMATPEIRTALDLGPSSRVFVINTEGATDPGRYAELVGLAPDVVRAGPA